MTASNSAPDSAPDGAPDSAPDSAPDDGGERQRQERREANEAWLRIAVEATGIGLWEWRFHERVASWDAGMLRIFNRRGPPRDAVEYVALLHPADRDAASRRIEQSLRTGVYEQWEYRILRPDGTVRWVQSLGAVLLGPDQRPDRIVGGLIDITERRELDEQRQVAQRMEALGQLAGGIAHNFNNMLAAILPAVELAQEVVPEPLRSALQDAAHATRRAAELVRELVAFARRPNRTGASKRPYDVNAVTAHAVALCRQMFGAHVSIRFDEPATPSFVELADGQLEQTLVNLLINARDAMEGVQHTGPAIEVAIDRLPSSSAQLPPALHGRASNGELVRISVQDHGAGMSEAVRARAFEPFFTTKDVGRGTGLGMSTAYATVTDHGGTITCESSLGLGTTVSVLLPACAAPSATSAAAAKEAATPPRRRPRRVLIVDDDESVARATSRMIASRGDETIVAHSAAAALAALRARTDIELVVLDCAMPGTSGPEALPVLRAAAPQAKVLYFSGTDLPSSAPPADGFLAKPATARELLAALDRLLGVIPPHPSG